jgi:hypothetical protein
VKLKALVEEIDYKKRKESRRVAIQGSRGNIMILAVIDDAVLNNLKIG